MATPTVVMTAKVSYADGPGRLVEWLLANQPTQLTPAQVLTYYACDEAAGWLGKFPSDGTQAVVSVTVTVNPIHTPADTARDAFLWQLRKLKEETSEAFIPVYVYTASVVGI
jgi:hypothetical protein